MFALKLFAVGVDVYDTVPSLRFCANDAVLFASVIASLPNATVGDVLVTRDSGSRVTATDVRHVLQRLSDLEVGASDVVMFYFAGHGLELGGRDYLLASDSDSRSVGTERSSLVPTDDVIAALRDSGAQVGVMVIDACRSDGSRAALDSSFGQLTRDVAKHAGVVSIFACAPGQRSYESERLGTLGHGVFTFVLAELLRERSQLVPVIAQDELPRRVRATCRELELPTQTAELALTTLDMATVDLLTGARIRLEPTHPRMLILAGPPHTGKSTVGAALRDRLGFSHVEMSSYAYSLYRAACENDGFSGTIQEFMNTVVWREKAFDVIAQNLLQSNHGLNELIVCGPRRTEEVEAFLAAGFDVRLLYLYTDSRTRYDRYRTANASRPQYTLELESFVRRDLTEYSWGLPKIGLMGDCVIVPNQTVDETVEKILASWVPRHWSNRPGGAVSPAPRR